MPLSKLERALKNGVILGQKTYDKLTDGWWLGHAPEHFLHHEIARSIARCGYEVFTEASPAKITREHGRKLRGRPRKDRRKRFDLVIWQRANRRRTQAIVEVKRFWSAASAIRDDADKIRHYLRGRAGHGNGYLVIYAEARNAKRSKRVEQLKKRASTFADKLRRTNWEKLVSSPHSPHACEDDDGTRWSWSVIIFKYRKRSRR